MSINGRLKARKIKRLSVSDIMNLADNEIRKEKHGNHKFVLLYSVVDIENGYKTVADGFKTKADAKAFADGKYNLFLNSYWVQA